MLMGALEAAIKRSAITKRLAQCFMVHGQMDANSEDLYAAHTLFVSQHKLSWAASYAPAWPSACLLSSDQFHAFAVFVLQAPMACFFWCGYPKVYKSYNNINKLFLHKPELRQFIVPDYS